MPLIFSLPNLHPAVVHFPVALIPVAALLDLAVLSARSRRWLDRAAATVWALAAIGAGGAYWAGRQAADSLTGVPPQVQPHIVEHSDWAWWTLWAVVLLALARLAVTASDAGADRLRKVPLRWLIWLGSLGCVALVLYTADLGGGLVYRHQVAVGTVDEAEPLETNGDEGSEDLAATGAATSTSTSSEPSGSSVSPHDRWVQEEDGTRVWRPSPEDGAALGSVLTAAEGSSLEAVAAGSGLTLRVDGRAVLVLPGEYGDVQVEADLDLSGLDGLAGVIHHVADASHFGAFALASTGEAVLLDVEEGERKKLATASVEPAEGAVTLAVSAVGRHLKGFVDGEQVTHGHTGEDPAGGAGLLLEGRGEIRVLEVRVIPLG